MRSRQSRSKRVVERILVAFAIRTARSRFLRLVPALVGGGAAIHPGRFALICSARVVRSANARRDGAVLARGSVRLLIPRLSRAAPKSWWVQASGAPPTRAVPA